MTKTEELIRVLASMRTRWLSDVLVLKAANDEYISHSSLIVAQDMLRYATNSISVVIDILNDES